MKQVMIESEITGSFVQKTHPIVYYHHDESRAGDVPKTFLKEFTGYYTVTAIAGIMPWKVYTVYVSRMFAKFSKQFQKERKTRIFPQLKQSNNWINGLS